MWIPNPKGMWEDHWIDIIYQDSMDLEFDNGTYWWAANVKWDGCIHLYHAGNVPFGDHYGTEVSSDKVREDNGASDEYVHICDLDDYIKKLLQLRRVAKKHFKDREEWNKNVSKEE